MVTWQLLLASRTVEAQLRTQRPRVGSEESREAKWRKSTHWCSQDSLLKRGEQDRAALARGRTFTVVGTILLLRGQG